MRLDVRKMVAVVAFGALALAACSSSSDDSSGGGGGSGSSGGDLTLVDWIDAADAICADYDGQRDALVEPTSNEELLTFFEAAVPMSQDQLKEMKDLGAPTDEGTDDVDAVIAALEDQVKALSDVLDEADGDADELGNILSDSADDLDASKKAVDDAGAGLDMKVCGSAGDSSADSSGADNSTGSGSFIEDTYREGVVQSMTGSGTGTEEEANCIVDGLFDQFTVDKVMELSTGGDPDGELADATISLTLECVDIAASVGK